MGDIFVQGLSCFKEPCVTLSGLVLKGKSGQLTGFLHADSGKAAVELVQPLLTLLPPRTCSSLDKDGAAVSATQFGMEENCVPSGPESS